MKKEEKKEECCNDKECCCCDEECDCGCRDKKKEETESSKIEELEKTQEQLKDALLRAHAEMENIRKRTAKEKEDSLKFANTKFAKELLEVIDNLERALENAGDIETTSKAFFDGIKLTYKTLLAAFAKNGITKIETKKADNFDHNIHQIMCEVDDPEVEEGKITGIYQNGYMINGRLLRPALVSIAAKKK